MLEHEDNVQRHENGVPLSPVEDDLELLFVDDDFPVDRCFLPEDAPPGTTWCRPHDLCDEPVMFVDGSCRFDVVQGNLGNCWSMAACAAVAEHPELIAKVVPQGQILHGPGYSGRIVIRLWHMNDWRDLEIDDRLPVYDDELLYARSSTKNEFWLPLVEKAFAKFHGGYQNLVGGHLSEGFINMTGYSVRSFMLDDYKEDLDTKNEFFRLLKNEFANKSLIACARGGSFTRGLPGFHGYTVTAVRHLRSAKQRLLRLRNPWGDDEWTGKWRDDHDIWKELGPDILEELDYKVHRDGEFWMKLADFLKLFDEICIGSRKPSVHAQKYLPATEEVVLREFWNKSTSGGPIDQDTFADNPQFLLDAEAALTESAESFSDSEDDVPENGNETKPENGINGNCSEDPKCNNIGVPVLIELLQDHNRRFSTDLLTIDFIVFKVESDKAKAAVDEGKRLTLAQLQEGCVKHGFSFSENGAESAASIFSHLQPDAQYVVVPYTEAPGQQRRFLLRVHTRNAHVHLRLLGDATAAETYAADEELSSRPTACRNTSQQLVENV